ncbi:hypothetical protein [Planomonospora sp. ID82291]|uniref:hypothetical protein n=1 Tax=Planomonospora sp. ID82291 TaxID=2738136 RepID=UPI0018C44E31|nr:hypothetical protein [Planomonospora sp. ID82291]MBG0819055.1 hypothetical protein [Planomonospora sp. ID82291]
MGFCFSNAVEIAASRLRMHYAEGLALLDVDGRRLPVPHAWVTPDGRSAVDVTWPTGRGVAYLGLMLSPAAWAARPWWESSPLLDVHARPELLATGLPAEWQVRM